MSLQSTTTPFHGFAGPLYVQVAGILRTKICASEWTARAPLPNEVSLARDIGVSIGTVRKALEMLENEHLIQRRQGRGTFVVETSEETELERFSNLTSGAKKLRAGPVAWSLKTGDATQEESRILQLRKEARVYRIEAVWSAGEKLKAFECISLDEARLPGLQAHLDQAGQFLFPVYRRHYQEVVTKVTEHLTAANASEMVAAKLAVAKGQAVMCAERVAYAIQGGPLEWSRRYMLLSGASYSMTMT